MTSEQDIDKQHRRVALELHPDKLCARDRPGVHLYECTSKANRAFVIITEAREQIRDLRAQLKRTDGTGGGVGMGWGWDGDGVGMKWDGTGWG